MVKAIEAAAMPSRIAAGQDSVLMARTAPQTKSVIPESPDAMRMP